MKMTIFKGSEIEVEKEINTWLKAERINKSPRYARESRRDGVHHRLVASHGCG
jgi:hypothetical protein